LKKKQKCLNDYIRNLNGDIYLIGASAGGAAASGSHYVIGSGDLGINPGVIVFSRSALQDKEKSILAMYRAYNKAVDDLNNTPQSEYLDLVVERSGFPPAGEGDAQKKARPPRDAKRRTLPKRTKPKPRSKKAGKTVTNIGRRSRKRN